MVLLPKKDELSNGFVVVDVAVAIICLFEVCAVYVCSVFIVFVSWNLIYVVGVSGSVSGTKNFPLMC